MTEDARLIFGKRLIHRVVSAGLSPADFMEVTDQVERWEDWCPTWSVRGDKYAQAGQATLEAGHHSSGGELLRRASICYHFGNNFFFCDPGQARVAHEKSIERYTQALPFLDPAGERVEFPFEGGTLSGILCKPDNVAKPPLLLMLCGLDSTKEEFGDRQREFTKRGLATLIIDGPGQGEAQYDFPIRSDFEEASRAAIDYAVANLTIDSNRIGVFGLSLGGYYSARTAAADDRIKCCVALSGPYDLGDAWNNLGQLHREAVKVRAHLADEAAAEIFAPTLTLKDVSEQIRCPLFVVTGSEDFFPAEGAERLAAEASGPVKLEIVQGYGHVPDDRDYRYRTQILDWTVEQLAAS